MSAILDFTLHAIGISHFDLIENDKFDLHQQTQKADGYVLVYDYFLYFIVYNCGLTLILINNKIYRILYLT